LGPINPELGRIYSFRDVVGLRTIASLRNRPCKSYGAWVPGSGKSTTRPDRAYVLPSGGGPWSSSTQHRVHRSSPRDMARGFSPSTPKPIANEMGRAAARLRKLATAPKRSSRSTHGWCPPMCVPPSSSSPPGESGQRSAWQPPTLPGCYCASFFGTISMGILRRCQR